MPFRSTIASISTDGKYLAYSVRDKAKTAVVIVELDDPGKIKTAVTVGTDEDTLPMFSENGEPKPLAITWMHWVTPTRLVVMTNQITATRSVNSGAILAMDADGKNYRVILDGRGLRRAVGPAQFGYATNINRQLHEINPTIFDYAPNDPDSLIIQALAGSRSQFCKININSGKLTYLNDVRTGEADFKPIFDRQGQLRGGLRGTRSSEPPFNYVLQKKGLSLGRWINLDDVIDPSMTKGFSETPENFFGERSIPLGFDENPDLLYYASNVGHDTYGIYALSLNTGKRTDFAVEIPGCDLIPTPVGHSILPALVFDRFDRSLVGIRYEGALRTTHWLKPQFAAVQKDLEARFPGKNIEIQEWDKTATRFLFLVHGVADPGSFMVYEPAKNLAYDIVRRATWFDNHQQHRVMTFALDAADGHKITGLLTFPAAGRFATVPVVVRCPTNPSDRVTLDFQAESMAIADMGFAVLQVNSRSAWGFGIKQRESIKKGYEEILIADITTAIDYLSKNYRINPQRVALMGERYGGFVALRGLQLAPDRFRCAVTIDATLDLEAWMEYVRWTWKTPTLELTRSYYGNDQTFKEAALIRHPEKVTKPVCLLTYPGLDGMPRTQTYLQTRQFASALRRQGTPMEFDELEKDSAEGIENVQTAADSKSSLVELNREFAQRLPKAEAAVYRKIEYFLNAYIYDYQVKLGPLTKLPDATN